MKLTKHNNSLETNIQAETQDFSIGDASVIIEILRNRLYKHKVRTLVQEYICNARDAVREAKKTTPILITAPNGLAPVFKVRDYGIGITPERMSKVFVQYGSSTKRNTNGQTGGFGIGAKSAWSYTDSFSIITFVGGVKRSYVAHTGVNNQGRLDLISTEETTEENGTEIQIAVQPKDLNSFFNSIKRAVHFWPKESYIIKGAKIEIAERKSVFFNKTLEINCFDYRTMSHLETQYDFTPIACIDGVVYDLYGFDNASPSFKQLTRLVKNTIILHLPNGFLEVSASREEVSTSAHTINALEQLSKTLIEDITKMLKKEFQSCSSIQDLFTTYIEYCSNYDCSAYNSIGNYFINIDGTVTANNLRLVKYEKCWIGQKETLIKSDRNKKSKYQKYSYNPVINISDIKNKTVYYHLNDETMITTNKRIRKVLKGVKHIIVLSSETTNQVAFETLIKDFNAVDLKTIDISTVPATKKVYTPKDKKKISIHQIDKWGKCIEFNEVSQVSEKYLYVKMKGLSFQTFEFEELKKLSTWLLGKGYYLCGLSEKSIKLVEGNSNFFLLDKFLSEYKPTVDEINTVKSTFTGNIDRIETLKKLDIKLKKALKFIEAYTDVKNVTDVSSFVFDKIKEMDEVKKFIKIDKEFSMYYNNFPILKRIGSLTSDNSELIKDLSIYVNAKGKKLK